MNLTIVTACWGPENIPRMIKSVDDQTYQNFQHIFVNDNHPETRDIIKKVCADDERRHWIDIGLRTHYYGAIARNIGAMAAFSYVHHSKRDIEDEWIIFLDTDNLWKPNHLESMLMTKRSNPYASLIVSDATWVGAKDKRWREERKCEFRHGRCDLGQFMYKTSLFRKHGYFFPHPRRKHKYDWELIKRITTFEEGQIAFTNQPTFIMNYKRQ